MNQKYIDAVKTAHKLCKEMFELQEELGEVNAYTSKNFQEKVNDYVSFILKISEYDWHIGAYLLKIALANKLSFNSAESSAFIEFNDKYRDKIFDACAEVEKNDFLTDDLLYLRDVQPDQS